MRANDVVRHRPTGECWVVASVTDDGHFFACGWPETRARVADADLVKASSDAAHAAFLRSFNFDARHDDGTASSRAHWARRNFDAWKAAHPNEGRPA